MYWQDLAYFEKLFLNLLEKITLNFLNLPTQIPGVEDPPFVDSNPKSEFFVPYVDVIPTICP